MPLTPATTDKLLKVGVPGTATTLASPGYTIGNSSINVGSTSNWSTDTPVIFAIDNAQLVNGVATRIAGSYCEFFGIVASSTSIGNLSLQYGTAQNYVAGSLTRVYIPVTGTRENMLIDALRQDHNGKGNHQNLTDDNGNAWLTRSQVASAVNSVQAANAATGGAPSLAAVGSDTNIDLQLNAKGTGVVKVDGSAPRQFFALFNFIESGCIWTANAPGSTLLASMTAGVVWINGKRLTVAAVTNRAFTANKDTYVDFQDAGNGTATVVYTEVANNTLSPVPPNSATDSTNVRNGIIVSGATSIAAASSINQGSPSATVPVISSVTYTVQDGLGYLIYPADPNRKILGYRKSVGNFSNNSTTYADIPGLAACPVILPNRKVKPMLHCGQVFNASGAGAGLQTNVYDVTASAQIAEDYIGTPTSPYSVPTNAFDFVQPGAGSRTYKAQMKGNGTSTNVQGNNSGNSPAILTVELY